MMSLPVERADDFVEAHEIADKGQVLAVARFIRMCECAGDEIAQFGDVAYVNAAHCWIDGKRPAQGSIFLLLWGKRAREVLVVKWCDDERAMRKTGFFHDPIDLGLAGEVGNVELAAADRF